MDKVQKHNSFNTNTYHRQDPTEIIWVTKYLT